jgi:hypothetical protein
MKTMPIAFLAMILSVAALAHAQEAKQHDAMEGCPMHQQHTAENSHHAVVEKHGDEGMGFTHDTTTHHFRMATDGGTIEVTANDPTDKTNMAAIRSNRSHIAVLFANGDFSTPMFVHDGVPPGVTTMKLLKTRIQYQYEEMSSGGRVRIQASDPVALAAIHDFLRFQISEHQTGDSMEAADAH